MFQIKQIELNINSFELLILNCNNSKNIFECLGFTVSEEVMFTTLLTISIFIIGLIFQSQIIRTQKNINLKNKESILFHFLSYFNERATYQINALKRYANEIEAMTHRNFVIVPTFEFDFFLDSKEDIFHVIINRKFGMLSKKTEIYQGVLGSIKTFKEIHSSVVKNAEICHSEIDVSESNLIQLIGNIHLFAESLRLNNRKSSIDKSIIELVDQANENLKQGTISDFIPFIEKLYQNSIKSKDKKYEPLLHLTRNFFLEIQKLNEIRNAHTAYFLKMANDMDFTRQKILSLTNDLKDLRSKSVLF